MGDAYKLLSKIKRAGEEGKKDDEKYFSKAVWANSINYETSIESLEPIYFWLIDFSQKFFNIQKLSDNFTTSPGSSYFGELGTRATAMQKEAMQILGGVRAVTTTILNIIYDLKDFELRLAAYDQYNDPKTRETGMLALKTFWMSSVDAKRGMGSLDNMAHQYGFTLLRPAFMAAKSPEDVDKMDLNDMVKRVLKPRIAEFLEWIKLSEKELRHRYNIQKAYLKSQIATLNLYTNWVKPYLSAAQQLSMKSTSTPSLVSVFNTMILELELMGSSKVDVESAVVAKDLPQKFKKISKKLRNYNQVAFITFTFRTMPGQASMHAGKVEINFRAYAMNDDELLYFNKLKDDKDKDDIFAVIGVTQDTLDELKEDIEKYTKPEEKPVEKKEESSFAGIFSDLKETLGLKKSEKKKTTEENKEEKLKMFKEKGIPADTYEESLLRKLAEEGAAKSVFTIYDTFKKSRGMASVPFLE